jgi:hypothetical protein
MGVIVGILIAILYAFIIGFMLVMAYRMVKAFERIARNVEMGARLYKFQIDSKFDINQGHQEDHK